jgi:hypothetical protein
MKSALVARIETINAEEPEMEYNLTARRGVQKRRDAVSMKPRSRPASPRQHGAVRDGRLSRHFQRGNSIDLLSQLPFGSLQIVAPLQIEICNPIRNFQSLRARRQRR